MFRLDDLELFKLNGEVIELDSCEDFKSACRRSEGYIYTTDVEKCDYSLN
jgi:hypothetical protein